MGTAGVVLALYFLRLLLSKSGGLWHGLGAKKVCIYNENKEYKRDACQLVSVHGGMLYVLFWFKRVALRVLWLC